MKQIHPWDLGVLLNARLPEILDVYIGKDSNGLAMANGCLQINGEYFQQTVDAPLSPEGEAFYHQTSRKVCLDCNVVVHDSPRDSRLRNDDESFHVCQE